MICTCSPKRPTTCSQCTSPWQLRTFPSRRINRRKSFEQTPGLKGPKGGIGGHILVVVNTPRWRCLEPVERPCVFSFIGDKTRSAPCVWVWVWVYPGCQSLSLCHTHTRTFSHTYPHPHTQHTCSIERAKQFRLHFPHLLQTHTPI